MIMKERFIVPVVVLIAPTVVMGIIFLKYLAVDLDSALFQSTEGGFRNIPQSTEEQLRMDTGVYDTFFLKRESAGAIARILDESTEGETRKQVQPFFTEEDVYFMTEAIYFEARGEPPHCQQAVGHVIKNRRSNALYPDTIRGVVWQSKQFSYTHDGKHERMDDHKSKHIAEQIAREILGKKVLDSTNGAMYYVNPELTTQTWFKSMEVTLVCGNHTFFR